MDTETDLTKVRSDKLLLALGSQLSGASANVFQALVVWQKLVELEAQLHQKLDTREGNTLDSNAEDSNTEADTNHLRAECNTTACELKKFYLLIKEKLPLVPDTLSIPIRRLEKDYGEMFKLCGL